MANSLTKIKTNALADDAVTGAKIADDTVAEANMANDAIGLAEIKAGTDGQILTFDASGNPSYVGPGSDGQVLTSTGAGSPPAFEDVPAGGAALTGSTDNTICTVTGANAIQGEANLTFDGTTLKSSHATGPSLNLTATSGGPYNTYVKMGGNDMEIRGSSGNVEIYTGAADGASSTERLRIDSAGRIGVGKTPASYHSNNKAVITGDSGYAIYGRGSDTLIISQNHYYDSSDVGKYVADGEGTFYRQANGVHEFWTAGSGSADGNISLAEKLRIQNGGGISFNGDSAAANALDDYEEGTFTPTIRTNGSTTGQVNGTGTYVKIGRLVHAHIHFGNKTLTSLPSGDIAIVSMPFTCNQTVGDEFGVSTKMVVMGVDSNATHGYFATTNGSSSLLGYYNQDGSVWAQWSTTQWDNSGVYLIFNITYFTNS